MTGPVFLMLTSTILCVIIMLSNYNLFCKSNYNNLMISPRPGIECLSSTQGNDYELYIYRRLGDNDTSNFRVEEVGGSIFLRNVSKHQPVYKGTYPRIQ
jgi:hypothetical protein